MVDGGKYLFRAATGLALVFVFGCGDVPTVTPPSVERNHSPEILGISTTVHHNDPYSEQVKAYDPDGDSITIGSSYTTDLAHLRLVDPNAGGIARRGSNRLARCGC